MSWWQTEELEWQTALSPEHVADVLRAKLPPRFALFVSRDEYPVQGRMTASGAVLEARLPFFVRNDLNRVLDLRFSDGPQHATTLRGKFRVRRVTAIFQTIWFGFLALLSAVILPKSGGMKLGHVPEAFLFLGMFVFGLSMTALGRWFSSWTEPRVIEFVTETLRSAEASATVSHTAVDGEIWIRPKHSGTTTGRTNLLDSGP